MIFWKPTKAQVQVPTYQLIEDSADDIFNILIQDGDAAGLIYRYGSVRFFEDTENGMLRVKYNYQLIHNPTQLTREQIESILNVIIDDMLQREQAFYGQN